MKFELTFRIRKHSLALNRARLQSIVAKKQLATPGNPDRIIKILISDVSYFVKAHSEVHDGVTIYLVKDSVRASDNVTVSALEDIEANLIRVLDSIHPIGTVQSWLTPA